MKLSYYVTLFMCTIVAACYSQEWKNPYDMYSHQEPSTRQTKPEVIAPSESRKENSCDDSRRMLATCKAHTQRMVNSFLGLPKRNHEFDRTYEGILSIDLPMERFHVLKELASPDSDVEVDLLPRVDEIISESTAPSLNESMEDSLLHWRDYLYITFWNNETLICLFFIFLLFVSFKLAKAELPPLYVFKFKYLVVFAGVIDFGLRWNALIIERKTEAMVLLKKIGDIPSDCDGRSLSVWKYVWSYFSRSSNDCNAYYSALEESPYLAVSPLVVLSHQMGTVIYAPALKLGEAVGMFTSGMLRQLPWGVNIVLFPLLLIFALLVICIVLTFFTGTAVNVGILGMSLDLHGRNMKSLPNLGNRMMIKECNPKNSEKSVCFCKKGLKSKKYKMVKVAEE